MRLKMNYKIQGEWLNIAINDNFPFENLAQFFDFYHISKKQRYLLETNEEIFINHECIKATDVPLKKGSQLRLKVFKKESVDFIPEDLFPLDVIYEDKFCLIVNKPAGYIVHGDRKDCTGTLCNVVANYYLKNKIHSPVRYIHRLDKETSGLIFFSKCPFFQSYFDTLLADKKINRKYQATVEGIVPWNSNDCDLPIGKDRHVNNKYGVFKTGKSAFTHFEKIEVINNRTKLLCELHTGRTHQIRVHLAHLGYPIVNDLIYGKVKDEQNMGLEAIEITWIDPLTQKKMVCNNQK